MLNSILKILIVLVVFISFTSVNGYCDDHTTVDHHCSLACTTCCGSAVILPSLPSFFKASFQEAAIITKHFSHYNNPILDNLKRPPVLLS